MRKTFSLLTAVACLSLLGQDVSAGLVVKIDVPDGRGDGDAPVATLNDFISQNPGAGITLTDVLHISTGSGNASNFGNNFSGGVVIDGFTVTTSEDDVDGGPGTNSGFNAGDTAHNDLNPITESYAFAAENTVVTIDGLLANSSSGDTVVLAIWGIGDNVGQQAEFVVTYGANVASEGNTQATAYNGGGARIDPTGSIPFVNFTFVADGVTDQISFAINPGPSGSTINAFSLTVVPEPSSMALIGLGGLLVARRRRR